jgi:magnesium-transporting ATPase (P-type)
MSDKTGTLTKNEMKLRRVSVAGTKYGAPVTLTHSNSGAQQPNTQASVRTNHSVSSSRQSLNLLREIRNSFGGRAPSQTQSQARTPSMHSTTSRHSQPNLQTQNSLPGSFHQHAQDGMFDEVWEHLYLLGTPSTLITANSNAQQQQPGVQTQSSTLTGSTCAHDADDQTTTAERNRVISDFLRVLVCCNTCMLMPDERGQTNITDALTLKKHLQAESPDEVSRVVM